MIGPPDPEMRHTNALRYSRWERLVFRVTGRWPARVAQRRLLAYGLDEAEHRRAFDKWLIERKRS